MLWGNNKFPAPPIMRIVKEIYKCFTPGKLAVMITVCFYKEEKMA